MNNTNKINYDKDKLDFKSLISSKIINELAYIIRQRLLILLRIHLYWLEPGWTTEAYL